MEQILNINNSQLGLLSEFIKHLGNGKQFFRYFNKRSLQCINNHLVTSLLLSDEQKPIAYGHLERENGRIWLGIATAGDETGKGHGTKMMRHLIDTAIRLRETTLFLTVDHENTNAIHLYKKFGFVPEESRGLNIVYKLQL